MLYQKLWYLNNGNEVAGQVIDETIIEDAIDRNIDILDPNWLVIGRQVYTDEGKKIDLLCMEPDGDLVVVELKRDMTPREVTAQTIDYASSVSKFTLDKIIQVYGNYVEKHPGIPQTLKEAYEKRFNNKFVLEEEDMINSKVKMVIVASQMDSSTERIINYLRDEYGVLINILFFNVYKCNGEDILGRTWFGDDNEDITVDTDKMRVWNGYAYVNYGCGDDSRSFDDAIKYGFISAGGNPWYTKTLKRLGIGDKIFAYIPQKGYFGYGLVTETVKQAKDVEFIINGKQITFSDFPNSDCYLYSSDEPDNAEYVVKVNWIYTTSEKDAVRETGMFSNQNTVCKTNSAKWDNTVSKLKSLWKIKD